ncbi:MAG: hypothetical protein QXR31_01810 [Zestosphaera sp.]
MHNQIQAIKISIPICMPKIAYKVLVKLQKNLHLDISAIVENWLWEEYLKDNFESLLEYYPSLLLDAKKHYKITEHSSRLYLFIPITELPLPLPQLLLLIILKHTYPYFKNKKEVQDG